MIDSEGDCTRCDDECALTLNQYFKISMSSFCYLKSIFAGFDRSICEDAMKDTQ